MLMLQGDGAEYEDLREIRHRGQSGQIGTITLTFLHCALGTLAMGTVHWADLHSALNTVRSALGTVYLADWHHLPQMRVSTGALLSCVCWCR